MKGKYVFVIGAGASAEAGLPVGEELKGKICQLLDIKFDWNQQVGGDSGIMEVIRKRTGDDVYANNEIVRIGWHINKALPQALSIDNFIDQHRGSDIIQLLGKLAIVRSILSAEKASTLYVSADSQTIDFESIRATWYTQFFRLITENCDENDLAARFDSITIVVFNYDRCLEHYLYHALQNFYELSNESAKELIKRIKIFHPYGTVGNLPWLNNKNGIDFGQEAFAGEKLLELSKQIKTFTESIDSEQDFRIRSEIRDADKVVFLGFAFNSRNMDLLKPHDVTHAIGKQYFASTYGISKSGVEILDQKITDLFGENINFRHIDAKCEGFFKEFWLNLSY